MRRRLSLAPLLLVLFGTGAGCPQMVRQYTQPPPPKLLANASLDEVIQVVNENTDRVANFSAPQAKINGMGVTRLKALLAYERPRRLRLQVFSPLGTEADLGSNDEEFWMWIRRSPIDGVLYGRHADLASPQARRMLPVPPEWLAEALGLVRFAADEYHAGPYEGGDGRLRVDSERWKDGRRLRRILLLDPASGQVLEQHLYDARGEYLAGAVASGRQRDPATGAVLPESIDIRWPAAQLELGLDLGEVLFNQNSLYRPEMWQPPQPSGVPLIRLSTTASQVQ